MIVAWILFIDLDIGMTRAVQKHCVDLWKKTKTKNKKQKQKTKNKKQKQKTKNKNKKQKKN